MGRRILVVGGGGREHSLAWKLFQSEEVSQVFVAPGNAGTRVVAENVQISAGNIRDLANFAEEKGIYLTVVGPENPLNDGLVDEFHRRGLRIFGPTQAAARVESSKIEAKMMMELTGISTAPYQFFSDYNQALKYILNIGLPIVIKADGLAGGKGVAVCMTLKKAEWTLRSYMLEGDLGDSGRSVVIEKFLTGEEISLHALCDGENYLLFPPTQDRKEFEGRNTGGMGVIGPLRVSPNQLRRWGRVVVGRTLNYLAHSNRPFIGCLYPGLMIKVYEENVLEFNCRFGDPETQVYMRLLQSDLFDLLEACLNRNIINVKAQWLDGFAVCVILASKGYPEKYKTGFPISGLEEAEKLTDVVIFHSGTAFTDCLRTAGGRVLGVTATGKTLSIAVSRAYQAVRMINFEGMQYLRDIGRRKLS